MTTYHANNSNYIDVDYDDPQDFGPDEWNEMIVSYLRAFKSSHPIHPLAVVKVVIVNGFMLEVQHYCKDGYYCVLIDIKQNKPILAKIYSNI